MLELARRVAALELRLVGVRDEEEGQTLVEYALIIALVSVALIGALTLMAGSISTVFGRISSVLNSLPS